MVLESNILSDSSSNVCKGELTSTMSLLVLEGNDIHRHVHINR